ncbi:MAG: hypothetical protein PHY93_16810 [Bacteriovorax sp.]|nr:hypothetical protein [Bacteriovorax sp.]
MKALNYLEKYYLVALALLLFFIAFRINRNLTKPYIVISKQDQTWNLNDEMIQNFNLGFKRLESSFLWISTILESDIDHYKNKDLNSWMFRRFNSITNLEPKFYENYVFGGVYLSVIKDDISGASIIFNKGLTRFPYDYPLLRDSSYHFFFEAKDYDRAYQVTQVLKKKFPNKTHFIGMITKLEAENGRLEDALSSLDEYQKSYPRGNIIGDKIYQNRYSIKTEIDLNCLNNLKKADCARYDLNNLPYRKTNHGFIALSEWKPYRRKSFKENKEKK